MPSAKNGTAYAPESPTAPQAAQAADDDTPGQVDQPTTPGPDAAAGGGSGGGG
jgi:hypothetical protein